MADLFQVRDQLVERLPVDHQTRDTVRRVADDVGRPQIVTLQRLLAKEVALGQGADELLVGSTALANRHLHLALRNDEERVSACPLAHNVVTLLVVALLQHVAYFDQRILGQVLEDWNTRVGRSRKRSTKYFKINQNN